MTCSSASGLPWRLGLVKLRSGPSLVAHLHGDVVGPGKVRLSARLDRAGQAVIIAFPEEETTHMVDDKQLREMTCDPKFRRALVTDGKTEVGQAMVRALIDAEASLVWVGHAEPWKKFAGFAELQALPQVTLVALDLTDPRSVRETAASIGGRVDILINTAEVHRTHGISSRYGTDVAKLEMDVNYFGLLRLAQEFGPRHARTRRGRTEPRRGLGEPAECLRPVQLPGHGTFSASKAAAWSLSQCLRAEMAEAGIRVLNVFPGPIDDEWNQQLPPPKIAPERLAREIVTALKDGLEDIYPGDVAQEWRARWRDNPKVLERELTG